MVKVSSVNGVAARKMSGLNVNLPVIARVGVENDDVIALGGLAWGSGRCWLWFHVMEGAPKNIARQALQECRGLFRKAAQLGETEVYTPRDAEYPTSERLLKLAGFEKTDEVIEGQEIWRHLER